MNATEQARAELTAFATAGPDNFYTSDRHFRAILRLYLAPERLAEAEVDLVRFGEEAAGPMDRLTRENNELANLPRLERYSGFGQRIERVVHHPSYDALGRYIYRSGVMAAYSHGQATVAALSRFYISAHNGEAGHNCPLACSAGVIRSLQCLGTPEQKQRYLPLLTTRDWDARHEGAQFLTELQGGSDVGANAVEAVRQPDGSFRIHGEKWFTTNIDADLFLMTARFEGGGAGTRGLGLFLVPRVLDDGSLNEFYIRRLKDKLGTRTVDSAETDFRGALAHHLGDEQKGFRHMMELVINTSRLYNALACAGLARRAYLVARAYAQHRRAFGSAIIDYALIQETLADLCAEVCAMVSGSFHLAHVQDRLNAGIADAEETQFFRLGVNLNKSLTAKLGRQAAVSAIEVLGGNGAIESFSVAPRLLRDSIVYENWEGTHNTLLVQIARDVEKHAVHEGFLRYLRRLLAQVTGEDLAPLARELGAQVDAAGHALGVTFRKPPEVRLLALRRQADHLMSLAQATVWLWEDARLGKRRADDLALEHFFELHVRGARQPGEEYAARIAAIAHERL